MTLVLPNCVVVDCSHWQDPKAFNWKDAVQSGNVKGIIAKLMQSGSVDKSAISHLYNAYSGGVELFGVYDFLTATDDVWAYLIAALAEFQGTLSTHLIAFDEEKAGGVSVAQVAQRSQEFFDSQGFWPTQYMGKNGPDDTGAGLPNATLSKSDLWLPKYGPEPTAANLPKGFRLPTNDSDRGGLLRLWQFTDGTYNVPHPWPAGVPLKCDLSYAMGFSSYGAFKSWWERAP